MLLTVPAAHDAHHRHHLSRVLLACGIVCVSKEAHMCSGEQPDMDRLRAVQRLVDNHEAVTKFAARGCGQQGSPPVNAPLSDPNARPGMAHIDAVDAGQPGLALSMLCPTSMHHVTCYESSFC